MQAWDEPFRPEIGHTGIEPGSVRHHFQPLSIISKPGSAF
jgi:hypothetical protein